MSADRDAAGYAGAMAAASRNERPKRPRDVRNAPLADALQTGDIAAIAFALRHGPTFVPLADTDGGRGPLGEGVDGVDDHEVWTYRDPATGDVALLLFSDASHKPASLPPAVGVHSPDWLRLFLTAHRDTITQVFLDVAGPHPMRATPDELLRALEA
jgi:hypothetical protein